MSTLVFDTLEQAKKLKAVGFTEAQAEAQTNLIVDLLETQVVTRDYFDRSTDDLRKDMDASSIDLRKAIGDLRKDMDAGFIDVRKEMNAGFIALRKDMDAGFVDVRKEISDLRKEIDARFKELELRMTIRLGTMMMIAIGIVATLIKLL